MDLKTFSDDDFDPKKWINKAWGANGNQEKEVFVLNTVTRLQLYMKQLSNALDETTTQIVSSIPQVLQEATTLQLEGSMLQDKLLGLERKVQGVEKETGQSIESLQRIDDLKSRLEGAASALREADKWAQLAASLEEILESGVPTHGEKLTELTRQVAAMTASLQVLSEAPDYESKRIQLEALYNRLEAALTPPVIEALTLRHKEHTSAYVEAFAAMGRAASLARYWRRVEAARLLGARQDLRADVLAHAHHQIEWVSDVLKSETPLNELVTLYTDVLQSADPSPTKMLATQLQLCSSPEEAVNVLIDARQHINEFVSSLRRLLEVDRANKETIPPAALTELGRAIFAPLRDNLPKYADYQAQIFTSHLNTPELQQEDPLERARAILSLIERCENWFSSAHSNAKKIAGSAIYPYYLPAVEAAVAALCSAVAAGSRRAEAEAGGARGGGGGAGRGVLARAFGAALALGAAAGALRAAAAAARADVARDLAADDASPGGPLDWAEPLLLEAEGRRRLAALRRGAGAGAAADDARRLRQALRTLALTILVEPIATQLDKVPGLPVWSNNDALTTDLPDFSLSPQEYITVAGQYLMTLPQHLELHLSEKQTPWQLLNEVCNHTCEMYVEKIMTVHNMDQLGAKRCLTDIVYLSSVVEDLGSTITPALKNLEASLRATTK